MELREVRDQPSGRDRGPLQARRGTRFQGSDRRHRGGIEEEVIPPALCAVRQGRGQYFRERRGRCRAACQRGTHLGSAQLLILPPLALPEQGCVPACRRVPTSSTVSAPPSPVGKTI